MVGLNAGDSNLVIVKIENIPEPYDGLSDGETITIDKKIEILYIDRLIIHEIGHAIGLDHLEERCNVMYQSYNIPSCPLTVDTMAKQLKEACDKERCRPIYLKFIDSNNIALRF
jgi:hypothetical protein